ETIREFNSATEQSVRSSEDLIKRAMDARGAMDVLCDYWKKDWTDFFGECERRLADLRMLRMSMDTEIKVLMASCKDVRQFFLDKDYQTEITRLKEFVELTERLHALKKSGFLDVVAETMLNLSTPGLGPT